MQPLDQCIDGVHYLRRKLWRSLLAIEYWHVACRVERTCAHNSMWPRRLPLSEFSEDIAAQVCGLISECLSLRKIEMKVGMPTKSGILKWLAHEMAVLQASIDVEFEINSLDRGLDNSSG